MRTTFISTLLLAGLLAASCSDQGDPPMGIIAGSSWRLHSVQQVGGQTVIIPVNEEYTIEFVEPTKITGRNLCNTYWATCNSQNVSTVAISEYVATKMGCPIPSYELEYRNALLAAHALAISGVQLRLYTVNGTTVLHFVKIP